MFYVLVVGFTVFQYWLPGKKIDRKSYFPSDKSAFFGWSTVKDYTYHPH